MDRPNCGTCPYFLCDDDSESGECHKNAPTPFIYDDRDSDPIYQRWPYMLEGEFCGEHPDFPAYIESLKPAKAWAASTSRAPAEWPPD